MENLEKIDRMIQRNNDKIEDIKYYNSILSKERFEVIKDINTDSIGVDYKAIRRIGANHEELSGIIKLLYKVDIKFERTIQVGFEPYAWRYEWGDYGLEFPTFLGGYEGLKHTGDGKFRLSKRRGCLDENIISSYSFSEVCDKIREVGIDGKF